MDSPILNKSHTSKKIKSIKNQIQLLKNEGLIKAGKVFEKETIELILGVSYKKEDWEFLGPYLAFISLIEAEGFFVTQRGMEPPAFRLLESKEMADHAERKLVKNMMSNMKIGYILAAHDTTSLNEEERKKHEHIQKKAARTSLFQQKLLMEDVLFDYLVEDKNQKMNLESPINFDEY
jgi:hypothetical protein